MDLFPLLQVLTLKNDDRCRGVDHVAIGATSKRQKIAILKTNQVGKSIVFSIVEHPTHIGHANFWQRYLLQRLSDALSRTQTKPESQNQQLC